MARILLYGTFLAITAISARNILGNTEAQQSPNTTTGSTQLIPTRNTNSTTTQPDYPSLPPSLRQVLRGVTPPSPRPPMLILPATSPTHSLPEDEEPKNSAAANLGRTIRAMPVHSVNFHVLGSSTKNHLEFPCFYLSYAISRLDIYHNSWFKPVFGFMLCQLHLTFGNELTVFDSSGQFTNTTVTMKLISLLNVGDCQEAATRSYLPPQKLSVQVLNMPSNNPIDITQCSITYTILLSHCESNVFRSDIYPPRRLDYNRKYTLTNDECLRVNSEKSLDLNLYGQAIKLEQFTTSRQSVVFPLIGQDNGDGGCIGVATQIGSETKTGAVVKILFDYFVRVHPGLYNLEENTLVVKDLIKLKPNGDICDSEEGCFAYDSRLLPRSRCERTRELFTGRAVIHRPNIQANNFDRNYSPIISVSTNFVNQGVSLTLNDPIIICQREIFTTNVDGVFLNLLKNNTPKVIGLGFSFF